MHGLHGPESEPGCASFEDVEKDVYQLFYHKATEAQNERNIKNCQRRTIGTKIAKECGLEAARQWLGHKNLMTTLRYIYTTETLDTLRQYSESASAIDPGALDALPLTADIN